DTLVREGLQRKNPPRFPVIPGGDFSGIVEAVGEGVTEFEVGDRVIGDGLNKWTNYPGVFAEYAVAPLDRIAKLADGASLDDAAAVSHVGTTAWCVVDYGDIRLGDLCLIHGGSGGVGHIAVQLADLSGGTVIATAGSQEARDRVRELGADHVFDYRRDDLEDAILAVGQPDLILDHMIDRYLDLDIEVAAPSATLLSIEASRGEPVEFTKAPIARSKDFQHIHIGAQFQTSLPRALERLGKLLATGDLEVEIAGTYGLDEAAQAHRDVIDKSFIGKLIVKP
ncbi:MAG: zinc-binding dehydrogenase, partial [Halobacteriales archaeon]|nr:zinc-binding dehydrogenase [Halobacteriales archaeon]